MQRNQTHFTRTLIDWFSKAKRELPWRLTKDPYRIWLSEIILQQTRVDQGLPYYNRFVENHPNVNSLAQAREQDVLKLWEGLGYYSRARNLHATAKYISNELDGKFPNSYESLLKLKGVGPYTAAAIASIAYGEPVPVVDGNVFRFISRYFAIEDDISKGLTRKVFEKLLHGFIPNEQPGDFNQAVMEYGATICTPSPKCENCIFFQECCAFKKKTQRSFPVKSQKIKVEEIDLNYIIFSSDNDCLLHSRNEGIWKGLYQFYLMHDLDTDYFLNRYDATLLDKSAPIKHLLTHRKLQVSFTHMDIPNSKTFQKAAQELGLSIYSREEMLTLPRPKVIVNYLQQLTD